MASSACDFDQTELSYNTSDGQKEVGLQMVWILSVSGIRMSGILVGDSFIQFLFLQGRGVFTDQTFSKGDYVLEYAGVVSSGADIRYGTSLIKLSTFVTSSKFHKSWNLGIFHRNSSLKLFCALMPDFCATEYRDLITTCMCANLSE